MKPTPAIAILKHRPGFRPHARSMRYHLTDDSSCQYKNTGREAPPRMTSNAPQLKGYMRFPQAGAGSEARGEIHSGGGSIWAAGRYCGIGNAALTGACCTAGLPGSLTHTFHPAP